MEGRWERDEWGGGNDDGDDVKDQEKRGDRDERRETRGIREKTTKKNQHIYLQYRKDEDAIILVPSTPDGRRD